MPETLFVRDFNAGWVPSDDAVNGRPNGLLQMDNLELDKNGALSLIGGTAVIQSGLGSKAHTLFSRYINNVRHDYSCLANGNILRDNAVIASGGDGSNGAFSTAFNYALICSGNKRYKDPGSGTPINLGVLPPNAAPGVAVATSSNTPGANISPALTPTTAFVGPPGSGKQITNVWGGTNAATPGQTYLQLAPNDDSAGAGFTKDGYASCIIQSYGLTVSDCTALSSVAGSGTSTDDDFVTLNGYTPNPYGVSLQLDILLVAGNINGDQVSDYFTYIVPDLSQSDNKISFNSVSGQWTLRISRVDFLRVGGGIQDWSTVYGFRITLKTPSTTTGYTDSSYFTNVWGLYVNGPLIIQGGTEAQFGTYQYAQMNVNNTGSYIAKSILGPSSRPITIDGTCGLLTPQDPSGIDSQVNEIWIFRRSVNGAGNLGQWYRILKITSSYATPIYDPLGDELALELNIKVNLNLVSIASITDKVYDIIGPIQGRWYYFTANMMYPSDINDPDLVDVSEAVRTTGSNSELFMWARAISATVVLVGTSCEVYLLTGTFTTFPDNSIDVYYQPLGVKFPPITYDAIAYGGAVYYIANDGWRMCVATSFGTTYSSQNNQLLVSPNTDRLYRNESCYGYLQPNIKISPGTIRYPVTIARNKLWCFITGTGRGEVYDFQRQYWRTFNYNLGDVCAATTTQDGDVLAFYTNDLKLREIGVLTTKLIDGASQQSFRALLTYKDNGTPRQRKDLYTFKSRCYTQAGSIAISLTDESQNTTVIAGRLSSNVNTTEQYLDLSQQVNEQFNNLPKSIQISLSGTASDLTIEDLSIDLDTRPVPLSFVRIYNDNYKMASPKRVRTLPFIIDTRGNDVTYTPQVDGVSIIPYSVFNTFGKRTVWHFFVADVFGTDYGGTLYDPAGLMEVWGMGDPDVVQTLPIPRKYDQVGPAELFRLGKIIKLELRILSQNTSIPYALFFSDAQVRASSISTTPGIEGTYFIDVPKGMNGNVLRVVLGPTTLPFYRYYMRFLIARGGDQQNTENEWFTLPGSGGM